MRNLAIPAAAFLLALAVTSTLLAQAPAGGEVQWFTPKPGGITLSDIQQAGGYDIRVISVGMTGRQGSDGLTVFAAPGGEYTLQVKAAYRAKEAAKVAGNIKPDTAQLFTERFAPQNDMTGYNATVHFSSEDRPGFQNVTGSGEIAFTLQSWAPSAPGRYEKSLEVGLFTPKNSPLGQWATIMVMSYPFTLDVRDPAATMTGGEAGGMPLSPGRLPRDLVLYEGDLKDAPNQLLVDGWGGGFAQEVAARAYYGPKSLQVSTNGFYQGVRFRFFQPPDITPFTSREDGYLEMRICPYFGKPEKPTSATTKPGAPVVTPAGQASAGSLAGTLRSRGGLLGGRNRDEGSSSRSVPRATPQPTTAQTGTAGTTTTTPEKLIPTFLMERMRIVVETEQGISEYSGWPLYYATDDRPGWKRLGIPLAMLKGAPLGARLKSVSIFGEPRDVFYLGQLKLCAIDQPLTISATAEPTVVSAAAGTTITFKAKLIGFSAPVTVSWDFDNKDGVSEQATGMEVSYIYRTAGTYIVTCTATDQLGKLAPATTTLAIQVQP